VDGETHVQWQKYSTFLQQSDDGLHVGEHNPALKISNGMIPAHSDMIPHGQRNRKSDQSGFLCLSSLNVVNLLISSGTHRNWKVMGRTVNGV
jgi:hypothetical protein